MLLPEDSTMQMKNILQTLLLLLLFSQSLMATDMSRDSIDIIKAEADSAYANEDFAKAVELYTQLAQQGESAAVYYNLGCTHYRQDNMAKAVLWFERAAQLAPSDEDIRFNLAMARGKTIDRIIPRHEMFFVSVWKTVMHSHSVTQWAYMAVATFILALMLVAMYVYCSSVALRKTGFFGAIVAVVVCIVFNMLAYNLRNYNRTHTAGIVMEPAVTVRSTPTASGTDLFVIHEGTRVEIKDNSMRDWAEIQIADGKVGWIEKKTYEAI